ncbi:hypothetical protein C8Q77DRAFT_914972 [Trametes polyzona]|nr:hypothetical protein C8Q77DRAFT_914972 [Trametes polyzona]
MQPLILSEGLTDPYAPELFHYGPAPETPWVEMALPAQGSECAAPILSHDPLSTVPFSDDGCMPHAPDIINSFPTPSAPPMNPASTEILLSVPDPSEAVCHSFSHLDCQTPVAKLEDDDQGLLSPSPSASCNASSPLPVRHTRTKARAARAFAPYTPSPSPLSTSSTLPEASVRRLAKPRALQITLEEYDRGVAGELKAWKCPFCPYVQKTQRKQDLERHCLTHCPEAAQRKGVPLTCSGVPISEAAKYGINLALAKRSMVDGELRVGGCGNVFSRADALGRHLKRGDCLRGPWRQDVRRGPQG